MTDILCAYPGRDEMLVTLLYDDAGDADHAAFDAHLAICARCRIEIAALRDVRSRLAEWQPTSVTSLQSSVVSHQSPVISQKSAVINHQSPRISPQSSVGSPQSSVSALRPRIASGTEPQPVIQRSWWRDVPAWAQVAAAVVCLGAGAGLANLNIRYDQQGLSVRTGWLTPVAAPSSASERTPAVPVPTTETSPWRADLSELERQLRTEFRSTQSASAATVVRASQPSMSDGELLRRVRALVEESERKQERELALRVGQVIRDVNAQRQADLRKIDSNLGFIQSNTGAEVMKQRQLLMNYLVRASSQK
jgi:hypothetical protein